MPTPTATADPVLALPTVHGRVRSVRPLADRLVEVTIEGVGALALLGGDDFVYALVSPHPTGIDRGYTMSRFLEHRTDDPVIGAYYTVRRSRPDGSIDLWVVDHGHRGSVGEWMATALPGDPVALWGPRRGFRVPDDARSVLLVADETGLGAVSALLDTMPAAVRVTAVLETVGVTHRPALPERPLVDVAWIDRGDDEPGVTDKLLDAVRDLDDVPDAAFGAGESRRISAVRRHLRRRGLAADRMLMTGYWRRVP